MKNLPLYVFPFLSFSLMAALFPFFAPGGGEKIAKKNGPKHPLEGFF